MYRYRVSKRSWFQKHRAFFLDRDKVAHVRVTPLQKCLVSIDAADDAGHGPISTTVIQSGTALRIWAYLRGAQGACNLTFHLITWGEHPRPTSRPADCPRMMGLVGWCGSNATIGNKGVCQLAAGDRRPGLLLYSNSLSSTTVRSVHYTCDPSSVFGAWHGDSHPPKGQTRAKVRLASFLQPAVPDLETLLQRSWNAWYWRPGGMICVSESPCPHASGCLKANLGIVGDQIWRLAGWQILTN